MKYRTLFLFVILGFSLSSCTHAPRHNTQSFNVWLTEFKQEAQSQGISQATLDTAFAGVAPIERIIELDRKQPETQLTLDEYLAKIISDARIEKGREKLAEHRALLTRISAEYGVQPEFIVALWGIETNFGGNTGHYKTVEALATLAYDGRRAGFFRGELIKALQIIEAEHISPDALIGSWAGAMGQCQFMPSSFLKYAVDYDHSGKRNIWQNEGDVFASIANYLHSEGWNAGEDAQENSGNFKVLLKWNRSRYFATAVGTLADDIAQ